MSDVIGIILVTLGALLILAGSALQSDPGADAAPPPAAPASAPASSGAAVSPPGDP